MAFVADNESLATVAAKLGNLNTLLKVATTDEAITMATVTEIPITDIASAYIFSGDHLTLEDLTTGASVALVASADYVPGDNHIHVNAVALPCDMASGSSVYFDLLYYIYTVRNV